MYHLIYNPVAGRRRIPDALSRVRSAFERSGEPLQEFVTAGPGDALSYASSLPPDAVAIAMGGDGTVQEVAAACAGSRRVLGILPAGSGDDFAFALGIDRHDLDSAIRRVVRGEVREVDTATANDRLFVNAAGTGFDADVARTALGAPWPLREKSAYLYAIVRTLSRLTSVPCRVRLDGELLHQGPALLVSTQNGPRSGGSFPLAPHASVDDGLLDVVVAGKFGRIGTLGVLPRVMAGTHLDHPLVRLFRGRQVDIEWETPRPMHLEGELLQPSSRYEIEISPKSLRVLV
ncbi:MAG TPA: diacylglycerol kinase family protein [Trueperaceae bacterium]